MEASLKATPLLITFYRLNMKYGKDYCYPSQLTILKLLKKYHGLEKCRATLNLWLSVIEKEKYIIRKRRIRRDPKYGMVFKSTMYKITRKGYYFLVRFGIKIPEKTLFMFTGQNDKRPGRDIFSSGNKKKESLSDLVKRALPAIKGLIFM